MVTEDHCVRLPLQSSQNEDSGMSRYIGFVFLLLVVACGGKTGNYKTDYAGPIQLTLVNQTPRPIEQILIYPRGAASRGTSWARIEPGASTTVNLKEGMFELVAQSAKRRIDNHWAEIPESSTLLELREDLASTPRKLVFYDEGTAPAGGDPDGTLSVTFMIGKPEPAKEEPAQEGEPATDAAAPAPTPAP